MDRLGIFLAAISGISIAGALVVTAFALGYYSLWAIALACVLGAAMAWPMGHRISRRIKRRDPEWHPDAKDRDKVREKGLIPKPGAPEI